MTIMSNRWEKTDLIQMSVQTADLRFEPGCDEPVLFLSCSLVNIARGSCQLTLQPIMKSVSKVCGELMISADRPIMTGKAEISERQFERMFKALSVSPNRPVTLSVQLNQNLPVSLEGFLLIDEAQKIDILKLQFTIPLK